MASESEFSDIDEQSDDNFAQRPNPKGKAKTKAVSKGKGKGKTKGKVILEDVDFMRGALKGPRNTTYSTEALHSRSFFLLPDPMLTAIGIPEQLDNGYIYLNAEYQRGRSFYINTTVFCIN